MMKIKIIESQLLGKLSLSDLLQYSYQFQLVWKGAVNSSYSDDFLELAESHNCIRIECQPYRYYKRYICKDKADYENLKEALSNNSILSSFMELSPLVETDWEEVCSKLPYLYVDMYSGGYAVKIPRKRTKNEAMNASKWEYIEQSVSKDDIFGDMTEGGYYIRNYGNTLTGYIYPPNETEKLYRAKLSREGHFDSLGYNVFIELDSAKEFIDETAAKLAPVTYDDVMQQLTPINKHPKLKMYIDQSQLGNVTVSIEGVLLGGEPINFYDSSFIRTQRDIDFIKSQYEKAAKQIDHMYKIGYKGAK